MYPSHLSRDVEAMERRAAGDFPNKGNDPISARPLEPCDLRMRSSWQLKQWQGAKEFDCADRIWRTDHFTRYAPEHIEVNKFPSPSRLPQGIYGYKNRY
jgi:hypothetical protein